MNGTELTMVGASDSDDDDEAPGTPLVNGHGSNNNVDSNGSNAESDSSKYVGSLLFFFFHLKNAVS